MRTETIIVAGAILIAFAGTPRLGAQRASPHETTAQSVDGAEISITYGRPYMRGRTIMGGLVPYGRVWCPGADEATTLTTNRALRVGDLDLAAGRYTLWMLPSADVWKLIVNKEAGQWHTQYHASSDLGRIDLAKRTLDAAVEQLTFTIAGSASGKGGGTIKMTWETTELTAPFTVVE
jgi:hypothetical protein